VSVWIACGVRRGESTKSVSVKRVMNRPERTLRCGTVTGRQG
jgi:hypothetical protein